MLIKIGTRMIISHAHIFPLKKEWSRQVITIVLLGSHKNSNIIIFIFFGATKNYKEQILI